jgi:hypothetical protein
MSFRARFCWILTLFTSLGAARRLAVSPPTALLDQQVAITASDLRLHERVKLRATLTDGGDHTWQSEAEFVADEQGQVDLATQAPVSGSYRVASPMGPIWSMKPLEKGVTAYRPPGQLAPQTISFELMSIGSTATAQLCQEALAKGVKQVK